MTQKNRTVKKSRFICAVIVIFMFSGVASAFAAPDSEEISEATRELLSVVHSASVEEVVRLIQEGADVNAVNVIVDDSGRNPWDWRWQYLMLSRNHGMTPLTLAARSNPNPDVLRVLIENGADVNATGNSEWTPLMRAARHNSNPDILRFLIESGANVNAVDNMGKTPLAHWLTGHNLNLDVLRVLIERGADVNITYAYVIVHYRRWTPLLFAVQNNLSLDVVRILIENGADVNATGTNWQTPLAFAVQRNNPCLDVVRLLIESGADVNAAYVVRNQRITPLLSAVQHNNPSLDIVQLLIESGADVNIANTNGRTSLMLTQNPDIVQILIESGADVNAVYRGRTPLTFALNSDVAQILIENGADVNAVDRNGSTVLMWVAGSDSEPYVLRILIENGADVNATSVGGTTPLMNAAQRHRPNPYVLWILIENGADVNAADRTGRTPLIFAAQQRFLNFDALRILIENGANVNVTDSEGRTPLLLIASETSRGTHRDLNPEIVRVLVENGADVNVTDSEGRTPLMLFAGVWRNSTPGILQILIEGGSDVNAVDNAGRTPLLWAVDRNSRPDVLRILIENGADVNFVNREGQTPLMRAVMRFNSNPEFIRALIENGADVNAADNMGKTPLMWTAERHHRALRYHRSRSMLYMGRRGETTADAFLTLGVLRALIENGADVNAVDNMGKTPLMWMAMKSTNHYVLRLLIDEGADIGAKDRWGRRAIDYAEGNEGLRRPDISNPRGAGIGGDVNLSLYHPWNRSNRLASLDFPASFRIYSNFPKLDGATSAYPIYAAIVNEVYAVNDKEELRQYLFCSRTANAYNRLIEGEVDMIFVLQPSDEQLELARNAGVELHFTPIARDAFVFFVNSNNPVSSLTIEQIQDIYLERITNWQEVGGNNREIVAYQRPANSGSQTAMINEVMRGERLPPPLRVEHFTMAGMVSAVATFRDREESIGYSFHFFVEEMMRDVLLGRNREADFFQVKIDLIPMDDPTLHEKRERYQSEIQATFDLVSPIRLLEVDGIAPTKENIRNGTYPLTVYMYAVTAGTTNPHVPKLIEWLLSPEGQELIERTGYVGVKSEMR